MDPSVGTLHVSGQQPQDTAMLARGGAMQDGIDVPLRTGRHLHAHEVVTKQGAGPHGSKHGILLECMARLVASWVVLHSFFPQTSRDSVCAVS